MISEKFPPNYLNAGRNYGKPFYENNIFLFPTKLYFIFLVKIIHLYYTFNFTIRYHFCMWVFVDFILTEMPNWASYQRESLK